MTNKKIALAVVLLTASLLMDSPRQTLAASPRTASSHAVALQAEPRAEPPAVRYSAMMTDTSWFDAGRGRTIPARIYYPGGAAERFPVIVFST
jgi:hypothetical protein